MNIHFLIVLLIAHFVADFVFQSDKMAKGKSSDNKLLSLHVVVYSWAMLMAVAIITQDLAISLWYVLINGCLHWATDYVTSRITKRLWSEGKVHEFFVAVGVDQLVHYLCLAVTARLMGLL